MAVLRIKQNGIWKELGGTSPMNGGNADTLDGKHASEFATATSVNDLHTDINNLQDNFNTKVGTDSVSKQIEDAVEKLIDDSSVLNVNIDVNNLTCSHSASEIIEALSSGKTVLNNCQLKMTGYSDSAPYRVYFSYTQLDSGGILIEEYVTVMDDKSVIIDTNPDMRAMIFIINSYGNTASHNSDEIMNIFSRGSIVKLAFNTGILCDFLNYSDDYVYFIGEQFIGVGKITGVFSIDKDKNISTVYEDYHVNIPLPYASDAGKVLVAGDNQVSWENASGKTLTQHLAEEDMILSSRQYGDTLPDPGQPGRIFLLKVSE